MSSAIVRDSLLSKEEIKSNIVYIMEWLSERAVLLVSSSDEYLSEYVSLSESDRYHLSGFTGSTGDMLITKEEAYLFLDGRYHIQGDEEASDLVNVVKVPLGVSLSSAMKEKLSELVLSHSSLLLDTRKISEQAYIDLEDFLEGHNFSISDAVIPSLPFIYSTEGLFSSVVEEVPYSLTGLSRADKLTIVQDFLVSEGLDFYLFTALDEISYLFNIRSYSLPYNSVVKAIALVSRGGSYLFLDGELSSIDNCVLHNEGDYRDVVEELFGEFSSSQIKLSYDARSISHYRVNELEFLLKGGRGEFSSVSSVISVVRQSKTAAELSSMQSSFSRADIVMKRSIDYLNSCIDRDIPITEKELYDKVCVFFEEEGAKGLSFSPIVASGVNSACIHYTSPSTEKLIGRGEFVLLDIGAYWDGGYATDLTRTFLAGGSSATGRQRELYSLVLKSAVRLMSLCFPSGTTGRELDSFVRAILWSYGYSFAHGTGHGIGICVHETPPSISINSSDIMRAGMTFSVEPGIYIEGVGGVRIENIVKVRKSLSQSDWFCIEPITFAPLDGSLIDRSYFDSYELNWLSSYVEKTNLIG